MTTEIKTLKRQRAALKAQLTRLLTYLNETPEISITSLETRQTKLEQFFNTFSEIQVAIEVQDEESDHTLERESFEDQYYLAADQLSDRLKELRQRASPAPLNRTLETPNSIMRQTNALLQKIELKPFDGNLIEWQSFHDSFKSLVHDNEDLIGVQKFHLLKNSLRGEVTAVTASLNASESNYVVAWELLQKRCNKPRKIIHAHLQLLLDLPEVTRDTPANLRRLAEQAQVHVNALKAIGQPTQHWDTILVHIITRKLDRNTRRDWERTLEDTDIPRFDQLLAYINKRARGDDFEEEIVNSMKLNAGENRPRTKPQNRGQSFVSTNNSQGQYDCVVCKGSHPINTCTTFIQMSVRERFNVAKKAKLCLNCLRNNHTIINCRLGNCRKCDKKHHTLLHFSKENTEIVTNNEKQLSNTSTSADSKTSLTVSYDSEVLLGTAQIVIRDKYNKKHLCRVLLDGGSQTHFITHRFAEKLELAKHKIDLSFSGLGQLSTKTEYFVKTKIESINTPYESQVTFIALPTITGQLPLRQINRNALDIPNYIKLADPNFHKPSEIDALIGNTLFYSLLKSGQIKLCNRSILLQNTHLGWIVTGEMSMSKQQKSNMISRVSHVAISLDKQISKFWTIEEVPDKQFLSAEESACEKHYIKHTSRDKQGRFTVRLPFNERRNLLGESKAMALKRFYSLERKLQRDSELGKQYAEFLKEYVQLGHMTEVSDDRDSEGYYLPHHAVIKDSSATTKVRVVFDASAKSSSGISLNDSLLTGPTIQDSLFAIIIRFRTYAYVFTADIEKMFRQIKIHHEDRKFQKILWRDSMDKPVKTYQLNTVTYGTASAPFLAVRCLKQLAQDESKAHPIAAEVFARDFYVDDLLTGASSLEAALTLRKDLIALARLGGFHLRQWTSNDTRLIADLQIEHQQNSLCLDPSETQKTLGIYWNPASDNIIYTVDQLPNRQRLTKRVILSQISQLFDPLGLLGPVIIKAKIVMQQLWKAAIDWDVVVPQSIEQSWLEIKNELHLLNNFATSRKISADQPIQLQLHGFCDASESAYGACIYIRSTNKNQEHVVKLLCAKSRVAPIKTLSLPRLELCAARLLVKLYKETKNSLTNINFSEVRFWSDSSITLHWIKTSPHLLKTFVANRVSEIQNDTDSQNWFHVSSADNPADFVSRGQLPSQFIQNSMWLNGPHWLATDHSCWPISRIDKIEVPEQRRIIALPAHPRVDLLQRYSSIDTLNRVVALIFRFFNNTRNSNSKYTGSITLTELQNAHYRIIRVVQLEFFAVEINNLENQKPISRKSKIINLNPFIDSKGILRVGGRLKHAPLRYDQKHPILLPHKHHITELIIRQVHERYFHAGTQGTLCAVRQRYWPIAGKSTVKGIIRNCIRCCRLNPKTPQYIMGDLPESRLVPTRPFEIVGIDYCGPFLIKERKFRNQAKLKCYVAVFVCFTTKAVHLELATDLTSESCLGTLKRFFARRGKPRRIYTDNATNFVGVKNEIAETRAFLLSDDHKNKTQRFLTQENVEWYFTPPRSPHFGGLWEAAVKSFKRHLYKTIGDTLLTFEQFYTLIVEIEAILNSRPLVPLSSDPNDFLALTPNHFLIGDSLTNLPEHDFADVKTNKLSLWQHIQKIKHHFWNRWQREYLQEQHTRSKWHSGKPSDIKEGTLVTIRDDNSPPLHWKLGRVVDVHPGPDGVIRVATVRTPHGVYKRSVKKLAPLPIGIT
ncbi:hypothetical protein ANTQUA_LOCUS1055 [Anthophora quadrimaculata]